MSYIDISKVNTNSAVKAYKKLARHLANDQKIEILFNANGEFTGHAWGCNCAYSQSDLVANGDYQLSQGDLYNFIDLTDK